MKPTAFFVVAAVVVFGLYMEVLPDNMATGFTVTMVLGGSLAWVGGSIPVFRTFGGAPLLCISVPCSLVYLELFPQSGVEIISHFLSGYGLLDFLVSALIAGSILSMDREILIRAGLRFIVPVLATIASAFLVGGLVGHLSGYGFANAILYVIAPVMGGGIAAGAIPLAEIYAGRGGDSAEYISLLVPAIVVANVCCILTAAILNGLGKRNKNVFIGFSGEGRILRSNKVKLSVSVGPDRLEAPTTGTFSAVAVGIVVAGALYVFGHLMTSVLPDIHPYAWMIIAAGLLKILKLTSVTIEEAAGQWYGFVRRTWIPAVLVAVSIGLIDVGQIVGVLATPSYLGLTVFTTLLASIAAGTVGWLVGMHYVETSITAGLCMADMGGSGDVAVLGASERMHLMPFAQISSRLGGALILVIMSILVPILM